MLWWEKEGNGNLTLENFQGFVTLHSGQFPNQWKSDTECYKIFNDVIYYTWSCPKILGTLFPQHS